MGLHTHAMQDTEDFAPDTHCLSGFTPGPPLYDGTSTTTKPDISALTYSLLASLLTDDDTHGTFDLPDFFITAEKGGVAKVTS